MNLKALLASPQPRSIYALDIPPVLNLTMLAPHPDDFDAIGVTLRYFHEKGHRLSVVVVPTGSGVLDTYLSDDDLAAKTVLRTNEQQKSFTFFGLPNSSSLFLNLERDEDDQMLESAANRSRLAELLNSRKIDVLFLPHGNDTNTGHQRLYSMVHAILVEQHSRIALLLNRDPKTIAMRPDLYMPFGSPEAQWKAQLLRFHDSQQQRNLDTRGHGFDERILEVNRTIAGELKLDDEFAEAFELQFPGWSSDAP